jgi:hypothetical protein
MFWKEKIYYEYFRSKQCFGGCTTVCKPNAENRHKQGKFYGAVAENGRSGGNIKGGCIPKISGTEIWPYYGSECWK